MEYNIFKEYNDVHDNAKSLLILHTIAQGVRAQNIIDIGVWIGLSTLTFLNATSDWNGRVVSVDTDVPERLFLKEVNKYKLENRWDFLQMNSNLAFNLIKEKYTNKFDIIHIDGSHDEIQVELDLRNYTKLLNDDGYILIHDVSSLGGPKAVFNRYKSKFEYNMIFPWNNGLGILYKFKGEW